jgi:hypothetical protein
LSYPLSLLIPVAVGGGGRWTAQQAYDISTSSLLDCRAMRETSSNDLMADVIFAQVMTTARFIICFKALLSPYWAAYLLSSPNFP